MEVSFVVKKDTGIDLTVLFRALTMANEKNAEMVKEFLTGKMQEAKQGYNYGYMKDAVNNPYIASAPGEYPGIHRGDLLGSMFVGETEIEDGVVKTRLESTAPHAFDLEGMDEDYNIVETDPEKGVRRWMTKALEEPDIVSQAQQNINLALEQVREEWR